MCRNSSIRAAAVRSVDAARKTNMKRKEEEEIEEGSEEKLLRDFWSLRGVRDANRLRVLGRIRQRERATVDEDVHVNVLPIASAWRASGLNSPRKINERYLQLYQLLGGRRRSTSGENGGDVLDVNFLVLREPGLLCVEPSTLASRLVRLASSKEAHEVGLSQLIEKQPSLLTNDDTDGNWVRMLAECQLYQAEKGDLNVSERLRLLSGSAASSSSSSALSAAAEIELASWIRAQRKIRAAGELECGRVAALEELGIEWSADDAEWSVMFAEYLRYRDKHGYNELMPYNNSNRSGIDDGDGIDAGLLWHWCSVQRVSARNKVMCSVRKRKLEEVDFDFSGVDAAHA